MTKISGAGAGASGERVADRPGPRAASGSVVSVGTSTGGRVSEALMSPAEQVFVIPDLLSLVLNRVVAVVSRKDVTAMAGVNKLLRAAILNLVRAGGISSSCYLSILDIVVFGGFFEAGIFDITVDVPRVEQCVLVTRSAFKYLRHQAKSEGDKFSRLPEIVVESTTRKGLKKRALKNEHKELARFLKKQTAEGSSVVYHVKSSYSLDFKLPSWATSIVLDELCPQGCVPSSKDVFIVGGTVTNLIINSIGYSDLVEGNISHLDLGKAVNLETLELRSTWLMHGVKGSISFKVPASVKVLVLGPVYDGLLALDIKDCKDFQYVLFGHWNECRGWLADSFDAMVRYCISQGIPFKLAGE